ncbi:MAG: hypothetical protein HFE67_08905, partial [Erysipelotrichaceae bacterium]|nr:hypothetical protein [Erysipelotrichaceae bacterium]
MESSQVNKENEKNLKRAKEIFWFCRGSRFHMWREELLEEFESYEISETTRIRWAFEMRDEYLHKLKEEKEEKKKMTLLLDLESYVLDYRDEAGFLSMLKYIKENLDFFDSENKIIIGEILLRVLEGMDKNHKKQDIYEYAIKILKDVCEQPITYADYCYFNGKIHPDLSEQSLKKRARQGIKEGREFWGESPVKIAVESLTTGIKIFLSALKRKRERVTVIENNQVNKENEKNLSRAKEIFWFCRGSRFHMWREELLEEFESYE